MDGNSANARTYSFENESVRNQLRNQHRPLAITRLIFSTLLFVMCLGYLLLNAKAIGARFESLQVVMTQADGLRQISMDLTMRGAWAGFFIPMIALGVLVGLGGIVQGLVGMRRTIVARDVPRGFGAPAQVAESFELGGIKGVFPQSPVPLPIGFGALKQASMMLTPAMVGVAQLLASSIGRGVLMAVIALLGTAATVWMGAQSTGPNSAPSLPSPVVCGLLVLALIASVVLSVVVLRMLMPKQALRERVDTLDQELVGAQKPEMIREYIVQAGRDAMERDGMPNRVEAWLCKSADQVGVGATVNWRSCVLIEQNPNPSEVLPHEPARAATRAGVVMLGCGWAMVLLNGVFAMSVITGGVWLLTSLVLIGTGVRLWRVADRLYSIRRFESMLVVVDLVGSVTQSKVTIGGQDDAVRSENETNRTHLIAKARGAMTLSETWALDAPRYLVSMTECDDVRSVLARLLKDCRAKTSTGVRVAAPVLAEPETEQLLQANVGVHRAKQGTQPSGPLIASTTVPLIEAKPSPSSAEEAPSPAGAPTPLAGADSGDDRARFVRTQARARSLWRQSKASEKLDQSLVRDIQVMLDTADALADGGHLAEATADYERVIDSLEAPRS